MGGKLVIFSNLKKKSKKKESLFDGLDFGGLERHTSDKLKSPSKDMALKQSLSGMHLPNNYVAIPHYISQSSIYAPRAGDRTVIVKRLDLWSQGEMKVAYEGPLLDTKIDSRLMSLVLKARDLNPSSDNIVKLKYKETMLALGLLPYHPNSRKKFTASIARHLGAKFFFSLGDEDAGFWRDFFVSEGTIFSYKKNILHIQLSNIIPVLFRIEDTGSFSIEDMLLSFSTKSSYATKLYSYYESNAVPFPVKVSTLLEICDKKIAENKKPTNNHRKVIKEALDELKKLGFLKTWRFDESVNKRDPMVYVSKISKKERRSIKKSSTFKSDYMYGED